MPNWACGSVSITGTKTNIINFASRFIYDDDLADETELRKRKFFARSFTNVSRKSVLDEIKEEFTGLPDSTELEFSMFVDFAWSAQGCLIDGYPIRSLHECITLMDACKADHVTVELTTEESGMCFEEYIFCDSNGDYSAESTDMPEYKCSKCGECICYPSTADINDLQCYECGESSLVPTSDSDKSQAL